MQKIKEKAGIRGTVIVRSHPAGAIERFMISLLTQGEIESMGIALAELEGEFSASSWFNQNIRDEQRRKAVADFIKTGKVEVRQNNIIVFALNYGYDILVQFLISAYTGSFAFASTLGIAWGEIGTGIAPGTAPIAATGSSGLLTGAYQYLVTFTTAAGETTAGPASATVNPSSQEVNLTAIPTGVSGTVTGRKIYRTKAGGSTFFLLTSIADNTTTTYTDNTADGSLPSTQPPTTSTAGSISPANTDVALTTPTNRTSVSYAADIGFNEAQIQFFFPDASLANETYYEFGTFIGGTSSIGSGNMFNHALFGTPYSKSAGTDSTVEVDFDFGS